MLIIFIAGACRGKEQVNLETKYVVEFGYSFQILVKNTKEKISKNLDFRKEYSYTRDY